MKQYMEQNNFTERTIVDKKHNYNSCYIFDDDGDLVIKEKCADCSLCIVEDIFYEAVCKSNKLCEHG